MKNNSQAKNATRAIRNANAALAKAEAFGETRHDMTREEIATEEVNARWRYARLVRAAEGLEPAARIIVLSRGIDALVFAGVVDPTDRNAEEKALAVAHATVA